MEESTYKILSYGKITAIAVQGEVTAPLLKQIAEKLWQGGHYEHPCQLWDFRNAIAGLGPPELRAMSAFAAGDKGERGYGRIALVVGHDLHLKLSQVYEHYTRAFPFEVKSFQNITTAHSWLDAME